MIEPNTVQRLRFLLERVSRALATAEATIAHLEAENAELRQSLQTRRTRKPKATVHRNKSAPAFRRW